MKLKSRELRKEESVSLLKTVLRMKGLRIEARNCCTSFFRKSEDRESMHELTYSL